MQSMRARRHLALRPVDKLNIESIYVMDLHRRRFRYGGGGGCIRFHQRYHLITGPSFKIRLWTYFQPYFLNSTGEYLSITRASRRPSWTRNPSTISLLRLSLPLSLTSSSLFHPFSIFPPALRNQTRLRRPVTIATDNQTCIYRVMSRMRCRFYFRSYLLFTEAWCFLTRLAQDIGIAHVL